MADGREIRLKQARIAAKYKSARQAALAMGVKYPTYAAHENGSRDLEPDAISRYARFFRVSAEWLMSGRGDIRRGISQSIPINGVVGAGFAVEMIDDPAGSHDVDEITLPDTGELGALQVRGDSQYPRFLDGEFVLFYRAPVNPKTLVGDFAVVQTYDGRRLLKILRRGSTDSTWTLESHNAPPERDVKLVGAWAYFGTLKGRR